jgi:hypothetical protein
MIIGRPGPRRGVALNEWRRIAARQVFMKKERTGVSGRSRRVPQ